jgi:hypothetical protein
MIKKIIIKIFHFIRRILTALRNHCLPTGPPCPYMKYLKESK